MIDETPVLPESPWPRYRRTPIVVEAILWEGGDYEELNRFLGRNWGRADAEGVHWQYKGDEEQVVIWDSVNERFLQCPVGYWIIRGSQGSFYPCHPDVFDNAYEAVYS